LSVTFTLYVALPQAISSNERGSVFVRCTFQKVKPPDLGETLYNAKPRLNMHLILEIFTFNLIVQETAYFIELTTNT